MTAAVMMLMGGFYWAIRGTGGYGGETGGMLAGFGWALLWYAFSRLGVGAAARPYGTPWILPAVTFGIALGGFTGYGVYISWVKGGFYLNYPEGMSPVSPWTGYAMLFVCGLHWGGNAGCFMAWCAPERPVRWHDWMVRIGFGLAGGLAAAWCARAFPQLFLPFYADGVYANPDHKTCVRALDSLHTIAPHVGVFLGLLGYEVFRRDARAVKLIVTMALGFALPFSLGAYWHTLDRTGLAIGWWKNWEMTIGLGGGLAFGLAFWLFNRPGRQNRTALTRGSMLFFRSRLPVWLPMVAVLQGLYEGCCQKAQAEVSPCGFKILVLLSLIPFAWAWFWRRGKTDLVASPDGYRLSFLAVAALQVLIVMAGLAVSLPGKWRLANVVLVGMYGLYLGVSGVLTLLLVKRLAGGAVPTD